MPGMYSGGDYDLAGFCVGVVEKSAVIDGASVAPGDAMLGLASSGPHSNGFSLIRKILERTGADFKQLIAGTSLADTLLAPTRIYVKSLLQLQQSIPVKALAHITGGGLQENIPRVLPDDCSAVVDVSHWQRPAIFDWLAKQGNVAADEMHRTFNCGIGMMLCVAADQVDAATQLLQAAGETVYQIGTVTTRQQQAVVLEGL
jgi:phosphoribosylformylglycinamidine cyclo-ligase